MNVGGLGARVHQEATAACTIKTLPPKESVFHLGSLKAWKAEKIKRLGWPRLVEHCLLRGVAPILGV